MSAIETRNVSNGRLVDVEGIGTLPVVTLENKTGCVDPRDSLVFITLHDRNGKIQNPHVLRTIHAPNAARMPGASVFLIMPLLGVMEDMHVGEAVDLTRRFEEVQGRFFTVHEDDRLHGLGCGHIDRAIQEVNEDAYGVPAVKVREMRDYIIGMPRKGQTITAPVLTLEHIEVGLLINTIADETPVPNVSGKELFRLDVVPARQRLDDFGYFLQVRGIPISIESLHKKADQQIQATVSLLANGLPVYEISRENGLYKATSKRKVG